MDRQVATDHRIAELAACQGGVVSRKQLFSLGLSAAAIDMRVRRGRLHLVHRGVYAVGHRLLSVRGRFFAALLAVDGAVLSHLSAAAVLALLVFRGSVIDLSVAGAGGRKRRAGIAIHRCHLEPGEVMVHDGLRVTTLERTLLDIAPLLSAPALDQCLARAVATRSFDGRALESLLTRSPRRPGAPAIRAALARWSATDAPARSELEVRFLGLCDRADLPRPRVNTRIEGIEVDFAWPVARLVVEVDGFAFHAGAAAFERDRGRDARLTLAGWRVLRFTWTQVVREPTLVAAAVSRALSGSVAP